MAFATIITLEMSIEGNRRLVCGQTTSDSADGDIATGLSRVDSIIICHKGAAVEAAAATIKSTVPIESGTVNLICTSGDVVYFQAIGQ
tara:strand:- start:3786 stop:4049 length:264 start_codon:yes stop_codon:yes gene_type:complete